MDRYPQIEAVEQRAGHPTGVAVQHGIAADTDTRRPTAARTRVHRCDEQEVGGQHGADLAAVDVHDVRLERLAQPVEHRG